MVLPAGCPLIVAKVCSVNWPPDPMRRCSRLTTFCWWTLARRAARMRDLDEAERLIVIDKETLGGEPVFKGTRIPVYSVVAMLDAGADVAELLSGYPKLDGRKLELGRLWTAAHPRRGR